MTHVLDRRHSPRIPCDVTVDYTAADRYAQMGRITNIGTAGVCLATQQVILPVGLDLSLHFRLPLGKRSIQAGGTVRWVVQWAAGVELIQMGYQEQDEIWRYYVKEAARQRGILVPPSEPSAPITDPATLQDAVLEAWRRLIRGGTD
ncbi:MAG: PilZ domain-containing protein [candidate division NC10 bacterium]|nr:PilZ domain-containing protein [candidate division NC10 bacterium]